MKASPAIKLAMARSMVSAAYASTGSLTSGWSRSQLRKRGHIALELPMINASALPSRP